MPPERMTLDTPLCDLRGIGPKRARALEDVGLTSVGDLLYRLPVRYEDRRAFATVSGLNVGAPPVVLEVEVVGSRLLRTRRRGFTITEARVRDRTGEVTVVWYNQPYLARALPTGRRLFLFGRAVDRPRRREPRIVENPEIERADGDEPGVHTGRIVPVYRRTAGLGPRALRALVRRALDDLDPASISEPLPIDLRPDDAPDRLDALRAVHFPEAGDPDDLGRGRSPAHRRLAIEEMYLLQTALASQREARAAVPGRDPDPDASVRLAALAREVLPFAPTDDQLGAIGDIAGDFASARPMSRLLQGDVGSGKTAVAVVAMLRAVERGGQAALLVPTEVLAEQHGRTVERLAAARIGAGRVRVLTGGLRARERRRARDDLADGTASIAVGTHALLSERAAFADLRCVVVDEQHRFGVAQRAGLMAKGAVPDVLVMTATPIPRTIALTVYGDLDLSVIRRRPPGRTPVTTVVRSHRARERVYRGILREVGVGHQAFVVVPRVDDDASALGAEATAAALGRGALRGTRVGVVHGRLGATAKRDVMHRFAEGEIDVLVATTVVEVGIDVPNATVMVVEHAERFGLAQLHQLRGRVGRGSAQGYCVLLVGSDAPTDEARSRLSILADTDDGFEVAERDLELRGPGAVFSTEQHGATDLRFLAQAMAEPGIVEAARRRARAAARDPDARARALRCLRASWLRRLELATVG